MSTLLLAALLAVFTAMVRSPAAQGPVAALAFWFCLSMLAERLWCAARDGRHNHKAAPFVHVAALLLLPLPLAVAINAISALLGSRLFRGRWCLYYAIFVATATAVAGSLFVLLSRITGAWHPVHAQTAIWLLVGASYHAAYQILATQVSYRARGLSWKDAWRENYGQPTDYVAVTAMVVVSVTAVLCHRVLGMGGVCLAVIPAYFVWDGWKRYLELETTQRRLIDAERLSAKGEMAGEIGHELNNYLAAIGGRAQLMAMDRNISDTIADEVEQVRESAMSLADLAKGLMDMSQREAKVARFNVAPMIEEILGLVRPQPRFVGVEFAVNADTPATVVMDPGLFQQILMTLLKRAVTYGPAGEDRRVSLTTDLSEGGSKVCIHVIRARQEAPLEESHPQALRLRGGDREIAGVRRMVERHGGSFTARADDRGHEGYCILFPLAPEA